MMKATKELNLDSETPRQFPLWHGGKHNKWSDGDHAFED